MKPLASLFGGTSPLMLPLVFDPMSARLAKESGFHALYLGGGALGYLKCITEANLTLPEMAHVALDIRSACDLPLVLDGVAGWGDPVHLHRTVQMAEAAGFCAIEIEDQVLPKRLHHHVGEDQVVPTPLMVQKVREAVAARSNPDFLIIARTNAARTDSLDEGLRRAEAYRKAGADMLLVLPREQLDLRKIAERLGGPLVHILFPGGRETLAISDAELAGLGVRILIDPFTPLLAAYTALRSCYRRMAVASDASGGKHAAHEAMQTLDQLHGTLDLAKLLAIERRTTQV